jgi:hypothetical protein
LESIMIITLQIKRSFSPAFCQRRSNDSAMLRENVNGKQKMHKIAVVRGEARVRYHLYALSGQE